MRLGAALIEVSWQLAVASADPSCDLAFRGSLERRLFEEAINAGLEGDIGPARHFGTLDLGKVPNLDPAALTVADALSIRGEDAFERFRYDVRQGLDRLEASTGSGAPPAWPSRPSRIRCGRARAASVRGSGGDASSRW